MLYRFSADAYEAAHLADMPSSTAHVRFWGNSDTYQRGMYLSRRSGCP